MLFWAAMDPICRRVLGVLVEKELTVPDSYPLSENTILTGANQKSNRDPEMALSGDDVRDALDTLRAEGWASRVESPGARTRKWRHHFESQLGVDEGQRAVLVELMLRGPQAPGALKPRVKRLGLDADPERIRQILEGLQDRKLVERQARRPRERDERWGQLLGSADDVGVADDHDPGTPEQEAATAPAPPVADAPGASRAPMAQESRPVDLELLERRVAILEHEYARLRARLADGPAE